MLSDPQVPTLRARSASCTTQARGELITGHRYQCFDWGCGGPEGHHMQLGISGALRRKGPAKQALKDDRNCRAVLTVLTVGAKALGHV